MFEKFLATLFLFSVAVGASVLTMIYGWGLQPRSWAWIIGCGLFLQMFIRLMSEKIK